MMVDLHIHSRFSDGGKKVEELFDEARDKHLSILSITDHNSIETYINIEKYNTSGLIIIPGIEIEVEYKKYILHMLLYNFDIHSKKIMEYRRLIRKNDIKNFKRMMNDVEKIYNIKFNELITTKFIDDNTYLNRVRLNELIVLNGYCDNVKDAFYKYTSSIEGMKRTKISANKLFELEKDSGGIVSLAHPYKYTNDDEEIKSLVLELKNKYNLRAVEVYNNRQTLEQQLLLEQLCKDNELLASAGSDYHARGDSNDGKQMGLIQNNHYDKDKISILQKFDIDWMQSIN